MFYLERFKVEFFEIEEKVVGYLKQLIVAVTLITIIYSFGYGFFQWLKYGVWNNLTSCDVFNLFCSNNSEYIGVNRILDWLGSNDFSFVVIIVSVILFNMLPEK